MRTRRLHILLLLALATLLSACGTGRRYHIAVLQCSEGNWRSKLNKELLAAQHLFDQDVEVEILNCHDLSAVQVRQMDSLADAGINLMVVAPNEYAEVADALRRTKQKGIPVILFDRKAESDDYTAFIGGNNKTVGALAANYAAQLAMLKEGRRVLEIAALQSTSPAKERHQGFEATIRTYPELNYQCIMGDWDDHHTGDIVTRELKAGRRPDVVFCHSDFMAMGAYRAVKEAGLTGSIQIIGVDGLPGPGEGIEAVRKGWLAGTCVYPTQGERIVALALDILEGRPYQRENYLRSVMITPENADMIALYSEELASQSDELVTIHDKLENYFGLYRLQTKVIWAGALAILALIAAVVMTWNAVRQLRRAHRRQKAMNDEQTAFYTNASHQLKTPLTLIAGPVRQLLERHAVAGDNLTLLEITERNVSQMEHVVTGVLNFGKEAGHATVNDTTAHDAIRQAAADTIMEKEHLGMLKQEDSEELAAVLIVDDNADMRLYLRTLLAGRFYVLEAPDGQSGLRLARESVPDIIVTDVMMPVMDGLEFCRELKSDLITSHIPVILLTARSTEAQQMEGYEHGADAYLTKPFNAHLLISRIDNLLRSREQLRATYDDRRQPADQKAARLTTQDKLFMDSLKEAINRRMSDSNLRIDDLGEEVGLSRVQMYRKVKALTGLSPVELLRQMRLHRGNILLNSTTKTVQEIAYEVGFGTPSYFSKCFKQQYGKYPMDVRT